MHVIRRLGASATTTSTVLRELETAKKSPDYWGPNKGDVQLKPTAAPPPPPPVTSTPKTSTTPTGTPVECTALWNQLLAQADPYIRSCISDPTHRKVFDQLCSRIASGQITLAAAAAQWAGYVAQKCPPPPPPPTASPPPPPPTSTPSIPTQPHTLVPPTPPADAGDPYGGPSGGPGDAGGEPSQEEGFLRQLGSVVGIGLVLAVGLTYARKKGAFRKLTKRRRRR